MLESLLDDIPLLGEVRRKALLNHFGSVAAIRKASLSDIATIPGIGEKIASMIVESLASKSSGSTVDLGTGEISG